MKGEDAYERHELIEALKHAKHTAFSASPRYSFSRSARNVSKYARKYTNEQLRELVVLLRSGDAVELYTRAFHESILWYG